MSEFASSSSGSAVMTIRGLPCASAPVAKIKLIKIMHKARIDMRCDLNWFCLMCRSSVSAIYETGSHNVHFVFYVHFPTLSKSFAPTINENDKLSKNEFDLAAGLEMTTTSQPSPSCAFAKGYLILRSIILRN